MFLVASFHLSLIEVGLNQSNSLSVPIQVQVELTERKLIFYLLLAAEIHQQLQLIAIGKVKLEKEIILKHLKYNNFVDLKCIPKPDDERVYTSRSLDPNDSWFFSYGAGGSRAYIPKE